MFSDSFIQLCRKAALPREWRAADAYAVEFHNGVFYLHENDTVPGDWLYAGHRFWLPREGDLLDLIMEWGTANPSSAVHASDLFAAILADDRCSALLNLLLQIRGGKK